jgi:hypothetical protein
MNNMQATEEVLITGASLGSYRIGGQPTIGDVLTFTVTVGSTVYTAHYTVQASDFEIPVNPVNPSYSSPLYSIALNAANAIAQQIGGAGFICVGTMPADLFSPQFMPPYFAEVYVAAPQSGIAFTLSCSFTGTTNLAVEDPGSVCPVNATFVSQPSGSQATVYGYVALLDYLSMGQTQQNLSMWLESATGAGGAGVVFNKAEAAARKRLYLEYCEQLSRTIGGETYVQMFGAGASGGASA